MTALGQIQAGGRLTAAMLQGVAPYAVIKGADETVSTLTLQNDDALFAAVAVNTSWLFAAYISYEGGTLNASDLKYQWTVPSGATLRFQPLTALPSGSVQIGNTFAAGSPQAAATNGAGNLRALSCTGTLAVGNTAGTLQFQWCTNTSPAVNTTVHAGSSLALWQIS